MLWLTDQQLSCGFWKVFGSLLSTLFCGVSPLLMSPPPPLHARSSCARARAHTDTHTHSKMANLLLKKRLEGLMHLTPQRHKHTQEGWGGQITSAVFQLLQSKQEFSLSPLLYLLHAREGRKESIFSESDHSLRPGLTTQKEKQTRVLICELNSV